MAEFTKTKIRQSVMGDQIKITMSIAGATGSTITTNLASLMILDTSPGTVVTAASFSGGTATLTTSGTIVTPEIIALWGR